MHFILNPYNAQYSALMDMADIEEMIMISDFPISGSNDPLELTLGRAEVADLQSHGVTGQSVQLLGSVSGSTE